MNEKWKEFDWPDWVPEEVRRQVENFWSEGMGRSPEHWMADSNKAPEFGEKVRVTKRGAIRFVGSGPKWVDGLYVHAWNNIGRVVPIRKRPRPSSPDFYYVGISGYQLVNRP